MNKLSVEKVYDVIQFADKTCTELTVEILNSTFPNVTFEYAEGHGSLWIRVFGNYASFIHPHTLNMFLSKAVEIYNYLQIIAYHFEKEEK